MKNIKYKTKFLIISIFALFSIFVSPFSPAKTAFAGPISLSCNSATVEGDVSTYGTPTTVWFDWGPGNSLTRSTSSHILYSDGPFQGVLNNLTENSIYSYRAMSSNENGQATGQTLTFTTPSCQGTVQQQDPTVTISANPSTIQDGQSSNLSWNSQNATSCSISQIGNVSLSGNQNVYPSGTTTYNITCTNSVGQQANDSVTVYVNQNQQQPTVSLYASPSTIQSGQSSNLTWNSSNASYCSSSWSGSSSVSGSARVYPTYTTSYSITCYGTSGLSAIASATVYVNQVQQICQDINARNYRGALPCLYNPVVVVGNQPTVVVYSDQVSVPYNGAATVRWITTNASSCYASGGSVGWAGTKSIGPGSFYTGSLTSSRTYTLTCSNSFGSATDSETISVRAQTVSSPRPAQTSLVLITSSINRNQPIVPTIDNTNPRPGDEINYTVSYKNIGTGSITNLSLRIDLPLEIDYISSSPNNPTIYGNTLVFNLGTLRANGEGVVTIKTRVRENISNGTNLNFPATLSYIDPSGQPQSVNANVSAEVSSEGKTFTLPLGANVFGAGFLPTNLFGWLFLFILILVLVFLAKYLFAQSFSKKTTVVTDQLTGKKVTTTTEH